MSQLIHPPGYEEDSLDTNPKISLASFISLFPLIGVILIFSGVIRLMIYYEQFKITILNYLDIGEILTSFMDVIAVIVILVIILLLLIIYNIPTFSRSLLRHKKKPIRRNSILYFTIFSIVFICGWYIIQHTVMNRDINQVTARALISIAILIFIYAYPYIILSILSTEAIKRILSSFIVLVLFWLVTISFTYNDLHNVKNKKVTVGTTVYLKDGVVIKSDSSHYYIGNTKNYIFFYDETTSSAVVIPMEELKKLVIPEIRSSVFR